VEKTADWIWMPFGVVSGGRSRDGCSLLNEVEIVEGEGVVLAINVGHSILTNGDFVA